IRRQIGWNGIRRWRALDVCNGELIALGDGRRNVSFLRGGISREHLNVARLDNAESILFPVRVNAIDSRISGIRSRYGEGGRSEIEVFKVLAVSPAPYNDRLIDIEIQPAGK